MKLLALETSCDETSAAVVVDGEVRSNVVSSQVRLHREYGGVVPDLATREHLRNLPGVVGAALSAGGVAAGDLDAVAATRGPGLPGALLVGLKAAQALAYSLDRPFAGVNHHEAHLYSAWIAGEPAAAQWEAFEPNVTLIVSGGHTLLVHVRAVLEHQVLGGTLDDAAGECFDKVAKLIGLPYPGGPELDRLAGEGDPGAFDFPRPMLRDGGDDFSFSGLKTAVRYRLRDEPALLESGGKVRDLCAAVQASIVEVLVAKTLRAARRLGVGCVTASGGVTCNSALRSGLERGCAAAGLRLRLAGREFCTDNAAMVGVLAERRMVAGVGASALDDEPLPGWDLSLT
jgi:N6-L-threonylcarbamoyladenine synthase